MFISFTVTDAFIFIKLSAFSFTVIDAFLSKLL
jgi:hypothetical protein